LDLVIKIRFSNKLNTKAQFITVRLQPTIKQNNKMKNILSALKITLLCLVLFVVIYPLLITGIAQFAPNNGKGEIIEIIGQKVGFQKVGQAFTLDKYFNSRPSAVAYNAAGSGGSNKGPSNPTYLAEVQARIDTFLVHNPTVKKENIPSELVTASGSGLDPNLSPKAAMIQVERIAKVRNISIEKVENLIENHIQKPYFGLFGMPMVNLLELNIALDQLK
jgi:potassium-transporting ATPase KdpC subunit